MNNAKSVKAAPSQRPKNGKRNGFPALGKLYYKITLKLVSPLIIGCGEDERSEVDVIRDPVNGHPLIPATSLIGLFSSYLEESLEKLLITNEKLRYNYLSLFGFRERDIIKIPASWKNENALPQYQSALQCYDVILEKYGIPVLRDGVQINQVTGATEDQRKYNYEVVEGNHPFSIELEITLRKDFNKSLFQKMLHTLFLGIKNGDIRLGAKTNKGFGNIELVQVESAALDFKEPAQVYQWISGEYPYSTLTDLNTLPHFEVENRKFTIDAWFKIRNSFLIKEYADESGDVDARHIEQNSRLVLPGTSVMGAMQHQARKIMHLILSNPEKVPAKMDQLFGFVNEKESDSNKKAGKGHLLVEETIIDQTKLAKKMQTRIKVDRFTGGVVSGALFTFEPLWQMGNHQAVQIKMMFDGDSQVAWAPGLLILLLKDLWYGDLPIGGEKNIGRGSLQGVTAEIFEGDRKIADLKPDENGGIAEAEKCTRLQEYITKLWEELGNGKK